MMDAQSGINNNSSGGQQTFPASTFPETFKDFFSMINEDEDHVELVSNLEDKVIPRHQYRGRNRSSSAKFTSNASLLPTANVAVRSNSFRVHRNPIQHQQQQQPQQRSVIQSSFNNSNNINNNNNLLNTTGSVDSINFCKHTLYCCLHQQQPTQNQQQQQSLMQSKSSSSSSHIIVNPTSELDFNSTSIIQQMKFNELVNITSENYPNFSDDEKNSFRIHRKLSADSANFTKTNSNHIHNKSSSQQLMSSYGVFRCNIEDDDNNCDDCSQELSNDSGDEFMTRLKSASSTHCLLRPRSMRGIDRSPSGATNLTFNFEISSAEGNNTTTSSSSNRSKVVPDISRAKSPSLNRRRASSITLARTVPNFVPQSPVATSPVQNQTDLYRYMKSEESTRQQRNESSSRLEAREKFTRSKSPNIFNRRTIEVSTPAITKANNVPLQKQQRGRTASMPAENRKPRLADMRRSAIHCADVDMEYYRLRSFSITSHGICNLGDSMRSRRSRSINSVTSSNSGRDRNNSTSSQHMEEIKELENAKNDDKNVAYKIAMLGDSGVGKTALTYQFTTSEYICAYDLSLDDDYGQKTVSVLLNDQETDLEVIDHPACEMSVEAFCSTYSIDLFVIVYSVVDRKTLKTAERILLYLKENEMMLTRGAILVGNKTDLERQREVTTQAGRKLAKEIGCKFIETSSGLDHNVDELLVGIVAQVKLNPQRIRNLSDKQRESLCLAMQSKFKGPTDHFSELRRNEKNKSNKKQSADATTKEKVAGKSIKNNKENITEDSFENESDDERSSGDGEESDIEKYFNFEEKAVNPAAESSSTTLNFNKLLKSRRHATPGMSSINPLYNNNSHSSNFNLSSSSCSTPTSVYPSSSTTSQQQQQQQKHQGTSGKNNKRDFSSYDGHFISQPTTPKKSNNQNDAESDSDKERCMNKFSARTKLFLTSFLKFKRSIRVKRRNSNSCSDLFVI